MDPLVLETLALAGVALPAGLFAIGRAGARRMAFLDDEERCAVAMPLGAGLAGLASVLAFWARVPGGVIGLSLAVVAGAALAVERPGAREARWIAALAGFALFTLALGWPLVTFGGGSASFDWAGHFERARWFLRGGAGDERILGLYHVPARPPLVNALAAACMAFASREFWPYQAVMAGLHATLVGPVFLIVRRYGPAMTPGRALAVALAALACAPAEGRLATFPWTKTLAASFALMALVLYVDGRRPLRAGRVVLGFASGALGILSHYSVAIVVAPLALDLALLALRDRRAYLGTFVRAGACSLAIVGVGALFLAGKCGVDLALHGAGETTPPDLRAAPWNLRFSLVPYLAQGLTDDGPIVPGSPSMRYLKSLPPTALAANFALKYHVDEAGNPRDIEAWGLFSQERPDGLAADRWLAFTEGTLLGAVGIGALAAALVALARRLRDRPSGAAGASEAGFWLLFTPVFAASAVAASNIAVFFGIVFVSAIPAAFWLEALGLALLLGLPRGPRAPLVAIQAAQAAAVALAAWLLCAGPSAAGFSAVTQNERLLGARAEIGRTLVDRFGGASPAEALALAAIVAAAVYLVRFRAGDPCEEAAPARH